MFLHQKYPLFVEILFAEHSLSEKMILPGQPEKGPITSATLVLGFSFLSGQKYSRSKVDENKKVQQ